jgi:hypothetical protein
MENWKEKKLKLKQKFTILLDRDLNFCEGHKEEMLTKLQVKLGVSREALSKIITNL